MNQVRLEGTTQTRLYGTDVLPLHYFALREHASSLQDLFGFAEGDLVEDGDGFLLQQGEVELDGQNFLVNACKVEDRRVVFEVFGPTSACDRCFELFHGLVEKVSGKVPRDSVVTNTSQVVCKLNLDLSRVFSADVHDFLSGAATKALARDDCRVVLEPRQFRVRVRYHDLAESLTDHDFTLGEKLLVIEPRSHTPSDDNLFFCSAPTDSETLFKLVKEFERAVSG